MAEKYTYVIPACGSVDFMKESERIGTPKNLSVHTKKESFLDKLAGMLPLFCECQQGKLNLLYTV